MCYLECEITKNSELLFCKCGFYHFINYKYQNVSRLLKTSKKGFMCSFHETCSVRKW